MRIFNLFKKKENYIKATKEGKLYIKTSDFFKQDKIKKDIEELLSSEIIKNIDQRNINKQKRGY